ncbi:MAG: hypothetical protein WCD88_03895, partial [Desulfobacterales bacterium]
FRAARPHRRPPRWPWLPSSASGQLVLAHWCRLFYGCHRHRFFNEPAEKRHRRFPLTVKKVHHR